jgi:hypothetical protein
MMLLSTLAGLGVTVTAFSYLRRRTGASELLSLLVCLLVALNLYTLILSTAILSEMVYALLSIASLCLLEDRKAILYGGAVISLACLTRSVGLSLAAASVLYFLCRRELNGAARVAIFPSASVLLWIIWSSLNDPGDVYSEGYVATLRAVLSEEGLLGSMAILWKNATGVLLTIPVVCLGLSRDWIPYCGFILVFVIGGFARTAKAGTSILHWYLVIYLSVHAVWPYTTYDRFLMPLLPFFWYFIISECAGLGGVVRSSLHSASWVSRVSGLFISTVLLVFGGLTLYSYACSVKWAMTPGTKKEALGPQDKEAIEWIKEHARPSDVVVTERDAVYYLFTGRKTVRTQLERDAARTGRQADPDDLLERLGQLEGVDFLVTTEQPVIEDSRLEPVFYSHDRRTAIYRIAGAGAAPSRDPSSPHSEIQN